MDLDAIQQMFFVECEEGLSGMEIAFALLRDGDQEPETINGVFRAVHSIKGGAGAFGHERLQAYTHQYETLLDKLRSGSLSLNPALLDTVMSAFDMLSDHVVAARDSSDIPDDAVMLQRLSSASGSPSITTAERAMLLPVPEVVGVVDEFDDLMDMLADAFPTDVGLANSNAFTSGQDEWRLVYQPESNAFEHGAEPMLLLRELALQGACVTRCDTSSLPNLDVLDPDRSYFSWHIALPGQVPEADIRAVFEFSDACAVSLKRHVAVDLPQDLLDLSVEVDALPLHPVPTAVSPASTGAPAAVLSDELPARTVPRNPPAAAAQTIRVDLDKLDRLVNLVGELVITQSMLAQRLSDANMGGSTELADLEHLTRELQESTMAIRAQPMKTVFSRVPRIIRELEGETGKRVRLEIEGEMTEVDKTVVERIGEPLTHLIRNAVDHGLEMPEDRVAAGKPSEGVVRLSAAHQSGRIVITVADDGKGIDRVRVRAKAVERGIILPDAILSDEEIDNLIFAPGFSTAETVSNVSGRGVGMDVVRKNVQALGGRIGIQSRRSVGSCFSLSLPLTLAVLDGMIVTIGLQTLVVPLSHIVESLRPDSKSLSGLGPDGALLDVRGAYVPVLRVADYLGIADAERDPKRAVLIVVEGGQGQTALLVDTILDQRQVVVKSLEANYQAIDGVAGATILGDGRVALIIDVDVLTARGKLEGNRLLGEAA